MDKKKKIAVIGGGAAGFFGAINSAEKNIDAKVVLFEASNSVLSKVLISGGGRCNVTNNLSDPKELSKKYPRGGKELLGPFSKFNTMHTKEWFERNGVRLKVEKDLRVFPESDRSESIAECLIKKAQVLNVDVRKSVKVKSVAVENDRFKLITNGSTDETFTDILLTSGGMPQGFEIARSLGHNIISPVPSLFTFEVVSPIIEDLAGVSFANVDLMLTVNKQKFINSGPMLITHWGLSGPAVIVLSSIAARELSENSYNADLRVNFLPQFNFEKLYEILLLTKKESAKRKLFNSNPFEFANSFWYKILNNAKVQAEQLWSECSNQLLKEVALNLVSQQLKVSGKGKFKEEFVTAGGVDLKEVDFRTMESKICPRLFFAGEVLNIDGVTGGFNFQSAWTTSWIAGQHI